MNLKDFWKKSQKITSLRETFQQAIKENDSDKFADSFEQLMTAIGEEIYNSVQSENEDMRHSFDQSVLQARGVRQLTTEESNYYQAFAKAARSANPKQALENLDVVMPETIISSVLDDLRSEHPLLSHLQFTTTGGAIRMMVNTDGYQEAAWGDLCDSIVKELTSGFKEIDAGLFKLSAFIPVCNAMLDLGPAWLDTYIRALLYEAIANGLEVGIVVGDGDKKPIGMVRDVGANVAVVGGKYPEKAKIKVTDLEAATLGNLISLVVITANGKNRKAKDLIFLVNPQDYYQLVMPATTVRAPDGTYRNDVLPYPITVIETAALSRGEAVFGMGRQYFAAVGMGKDGRIEYDDSVRFLEDQRVYKAKLYANGLPLDNNAFLHLDVSGLQPMTYRVTTVPAPAASTDATLSALKLGSLNLTPGFTSGNVTYTATTSAASNTITATPANAGAKVKVEVGGKEIENGKPATWSEGSNTVTITVTAADGETVKTYTVTVTKS